MGKLIHLGYPQQKSGSFMHAAIYENGKLKVERIPKPVISPDQILLRVVCTGLCGTDVKKIWFNLLGLGKRDPRVFGHEIVGEVVECGSQVRMVSVGDRVAVFHHVPCLGSECKPCNEKRFSQCPTYANVDTSAGYGKPSGGGFVEYIVVQKEVIARGLIKIPSGISYEEAVFVEPLNCVLKATSMFKKFGQAIEKGEPVLIIGQGANGLLFTQILTRLYGANVLSIEPNAYRRNRSEGFGAIALKPGEARSLKGFGIRKAIVACASEKAILSAVDLIEEGGIAVYFGDLISDSSGRKHWNELSRTEQPSVIRNRLVVPSYSSAFELHDETSELVFGRQLELRSLITHRVGLLDLNAAIKGFVAAKMYADSAQSVLKVLVQSDIDANSQYAVPYTQWLGFFISKFVVPAVAVAGLCLMVLAGVGFHKQHTKFLKSGCVNLPYSCDYVCEKDLGPMSGKFKAEKDGKVFYYDYTCGSPP